MKATDRLTRIDTIEAIDAQPAFNDLRLPALSCELKRGSMCFLSGEHPGYLSAYLYMLAGADLPAAGTVNLERHATHQLSYHQRQQVRQKIAVVMQGGPLLATVNGLQNLKLAAQYHRVGDESSQQQTISTLLSGFISDDTYTLLPAYMTRLQRRLLAITRPLLLDPDFLLLDNPFDGLGVHDCHEVARYIVKIFQLLHTGVVVCSDDLRFMQQLPEQVIFCDQLEARFFNSWQDFLHSKRQTAPPISDMEN